MQPFVVFLGIVMGSTVSIAVGLAMTVIVFLALPEYKDRLSGEFGPLLRYFAAATLLAIVAVLAFVGQLRGRQWRLAAQLALLCGLGSVVLWYWWRWRAAF
jgi:hypothetical protein